METIKKTINNHILENIVSYLGVQETVGYCGQKNYYTSKPFSELSKSIFELGIKKIYLTSNSIIIPHDREEIEIQMAELFN